MSDDVERGLAMAQARTEALFDEIVATKMIRPHVTEGALSREIHALAVAKYGVKKHWHRRIVRAGPNTLETFSANPPERTIEEDDVVFLDLGPVFEEWEGDFGRTYVIGEDPKKQKLVRDIAAAFARGKRHYETTPDLTAGALYDYVSALALEMGWEFGPKTAGHLVGKFPHERETKPQRAFSIRHGNTLSLRAPDAEGNARHWILEIHFVDRTRRFGGFYEELLTVDPSLFAPL